MAFGEPTKIWRLSLEKVKGGTGGWDYAVTEASLDYGSRIVRNKSLPVVEISCSDFVSPEIVVTD